MIAILPEPIKREVLDNLQSGNFVAAKAIHDRWIANHYHEDISQPNDNYAAVDYKPN